MPGKKYYLDPDTLQYKPSRLPLKRKLFRFFTGGLASVLLAFLYFFLLSHFMDSPKEMHLKEQQAQLRLQYDLMNRKLDHLSMQIQDMEMNDDQIYRPVVQSDPIPFSLRNPATGGVKQYAELEAFDNGNLMISTLERLDQLKKKAYVQSRSFEELILLESEREEMLKHMPLISPISYKDLLWLGDGIKYREKHPVLGVGKYHNGQDFTANKGTPVYATGDGEVAIAGWTPYGFGNEVKIDHGYGFITIYAHLSKVLVKKGEKVYRGQLLGEVGNTGLSDGNHLHYEIHKDGKVVNPLYYFHDNLSKEEFEEMLEVMAELDTLYRDSN